MSRLILASSSPRRQELLAMLGQEFEIAVPDVDESLLIDETPRSYVERLAIAKATKISHTKNFQTDLVIGSDVTLDFAEKSIGKAENPEDAKKILTDLSGKTHLIRCGVALVENGAVLMSATATTFVEFRELEPQLLNWYLTTGEWSGVAGAYRIQEQGAVLVENYRGSIFNIIGLSLHLVAGALQSTHFAVSRSVLDQLRLAEIDARQSFLMRREQYLKQALPNNY